MKRPRAHLYYSEVAALQEMLAKGGIREMQNDQMLEQKKQRINQMSFVPAWTIHILTL
jgi:hypothetical protein